MRDIEAETPAILTRIHGHMLSQRKNPSGLDDGC